VALTSSTPALPRDVAPSAYRVGDQQRPRRLSFEDLESTEHLAQIVEAERSRADGGPVHARK
jgi:hypothetical protein